MLDIGFDHFCLMYVPRYFKCSVNMIISAFKSRWLQCFGFFFLLWLYKCAYMRFSLSPCKKFISTFVLSGWVLWSRGCGSVRLHSPLCGMVPPSLIMPSGQQYPLSFQEKTTKEKENNSFWNQKHYVVPQITTDSLPPGLEFTHTNPPPRSRLLYPICQMGSVCKRCF